MDAGDVFRPISSNTLLGLKEQHPYGPYCNLKDGRNPIFAKVTGLVSRVCARSGMFLIGWDVKALWTMMIGFNRSISIFVYWALSLQDYQNMALLFPSRFQLRSSSSLSPPRPGSQINQNIIRNILYQSSNHPILLWSPHNPSTGFTPCPCKKTHPHQNESCTLPPSHNCYGN
jgi:hypothetical protein